MLSINTIFKRTLLEYSLMSKGKEEKSFTVFRLGLEYLRQKMNLKHMTSFIHLLATNARHSNGLKTYVLFAAMFSFLRNVECAS